MLMSVVALALSGHGMSLDADTLRAPWLLETQKHRRVAEARRIREKGEICIAVLGSQ